MRGHAPKLANMENAVVLQDDNARPHRARAVTNVYLHNIAHLDWPANSPDVSSIEHLWDELERRLRPHLRPYNTLAYFDCRSGMLPLRGKCNASLTA